MTINSGNEGYAIEIINSLLILFSQEITESSNLLKITKWCVEKSKLAASY